MTSHLSESVNAKEQCLCVRSPDPLRVGRVRHVRPGGLLHGLLVELLLGEGDGAQWTHAQ